MSKKFQALKFWVGDNPEVSDALQVMLETRGYDTTYVKREHTVIWTIESGRVDSSGLSRMGYKSIGRLAIDTDWMLPPVISTITLPDGRVFDKEEFEGAVKRLKEVT